ncbi:MAG: Ig-like domain-containing protein [Actinomycetota bacterium]|nr:Ig-like domain-containing protein [Actinomycetota bacterium]
MTDPPVSAGEEQLEPVAPPSRRPARSRLLSVGVVLVVMWAAIAAAFQSGGQGMAERAQEERTGELVGPTPTDTVLPELDLAPDTGTTIDKPPRPQQTAPSSSEPRRQGGVGPDRAPPSPPSPPSPPDGPTLRRPIPAPQSEPSEEPEPGLAPWSVTTRTTDAGYVATDVGCTADSSAAALDDFFADRIGPVIGHDYQHVYPLGDGRSLWIFQDTFVDHPGVAGSFDRSRFSHNTAMLQDGDCFTLLHRGTAGEPASFEQGTGETTLSRWFWPMGGETSDGVLSVFWVEMINTDDPLGPFDGLSWHPNSTWLATYDADSLARLDFRPAPNAGVQPVYGYAVSSDEEYTYLFGNSFDQNLYRQGGYANGPHSATATWLARVPLGQLDEAPEYRTAEGWSADASDARPILQRFWAENPMQPRYLGGQWVAATKVDGYWGDELMIDVANEPWGPWTTVSRTAAAPRGNDPLMLTYHAYLMPWLDDSGSLVVSLSQNARLMLRHAWPFPFRYRLRFEPAAFVTPPPDPPRDPPPDRPTTTSADPPPTRETAPPTTVPSTTVPPTTVPPTTARSPARRPSSPPVTRPRPPTTITAPPITTTKPPATTTKPPVTTTSSQPPETAAPAAADDRRSTPFGRSLDVPVADNDVAAEGAQIDPSSVALAGGAREVDVDGGRFSVLAGGAVRFAPTPGFQGTASIRYTVADDGERRGTARLTVDVADPPQAIADRWSGTQGIEVGRNPLVNDRGSIGRSTDLLRDTVAFTEDGQPAGARRGDDGATLDVPGEGGYTIDDEGWVTFRPHPSFAGATRSIRYTVADTDLVRTTSTITVDVSRAVPQARDDFERTAFDTALDVTVLANDLPAGGAFTVRFPADGQPAGGSVSDDGRSLDVPGQGQSTIGESGVVTFDPVFGFTGPSAAMRYEVTDPDGQRDTALLAVAVDEPAFGTDDEVSTSAPGLIEVDVIDNDEPAEDAELERGTSLLRSEGLPEGTVLSDDGTSLDVPGEGAYTVDDEGVVTYTRAEGFEAMTTPVWYTVLDSNGTQGAARLTITVEP